MPSVIMVDDEIWALRDLESLLSPYPRYNILATFTDSKKALDAIKSMQPDVVFTDLCMGDLDGRELINEIHKHTPRTIIVIVSAYRDFAAAQEALQRNVVDYLLKPLSPENIGALIARIDTAFARSTQRRISPAETFAAQLRSVAVYPCCYALSFPETAQTEETLHCLHGQFPGNCSMAWAAEPGSSERILLLSAPTARAEEILARLPGDAGISCAHANFTNFQVMKKEAVASRMCAFRYAANTKVAAIESYLAVHYAKDITLDNLAQHFYLSKNYLCDMFRSTTGTTVLNFLIKIRLAFAARLLQTSEHSIREIADMVGYDDSAYFSRAFKKFYGVSPEAWRREGE